MSSNNNSLPLPPIFVGENYHLGMAKMRIYVRVQSLWVIMKNESNSPPLLHYSITKNPIIA
uniref:Uncharacterized protein n=1 Tax=Cajanus cajan TaxID=3821 RepID=A0A151R4B0_CAJCA|nr:hypothetical protein KK1_041507 [Cajanus cajan]